MEFVDIEEIFYNSWKNSKATDEDIQEALFMQALTLSEFVFILNGRRKHSYLENPAYRCEFMREFFLYDFIEREIKSGSVAALGNKGKRGFCTSQDQITNRFGQTNNRYWIRPIELLYWLLVNNHLEISVQDRGVLALIIKVLEPFVPVPKKPGRPINGPKNYDDLAELSKKHTTLTARELLNEIEAKPYVDKLTSGVEDVGVKLCKIANRLDKHPQFAGVKKKQLFPKLVSFR